MKDYLKEFATAAAHTTWMSSENYITPSVAYITENGGSVDYHIPYDYNKDYLTFTALQDTKFTFTQNTLQYSLDDGDTWTSLTANTASPIVTTGNKILWKATLTPSSTSPRGIGTFSSTSGNFDVSGNIMSLLFGDNFIGQTDLTGKDYAFNSLFNGNTKLINAENLVLPATILSQHCYEAMFNSCTKLTTAPDLPATTLAYYCYDQMFYGCTLLTTAPELPATTLANFCYMSMFEGCGLLTAPELPATTLRQACYYQMFKGCGSLTTAPELPAAKLDNDCYYQMFYNCTSLNYIKCLATNKTASSCTTGWVNNVAVTGTFIKDANTSWQGGSDAIPYGWTIQNAA